MEGVELCAEKLGLTVIDRKIASKSNRKVFSELKHSFPEVDYKRYESIRSVHNFFCGVTQSRCKAVDAHVCFYVQNGERRSTHLRLWAIHGIRLWLNLSGFYGSCRPLLLVVHYEKVSTTAPRAAAAFAVICSCWSLRPLMQPRRVFG